MLDLDSVAPAAREDVDTLYFLLTRSFGDTYFRFSIYQSGKSKAFLQEQIERGVHAQQPRFFVARHGSKIIGFYNAEPLDGEFFLKYIATDPMVKGQGIGTALLRHFEETGVRLGCSRAGLGVFRSNSVAEPWYRRRGYETAGVELFQRFDLKKLSRPGPERLEWDEPAFDAALAAERDRGFSAFDATCDGQPVLIGLLGGETCNLLRLGAVPPTALATAVARKLGAQRHWLLLRSPAAIDLTALAETVEESLHLVRRLDQVSEGLQGG